MGRQVGPIPRSRAQELSGSASSSDSERTGSSLTERIMGIVAKANTDGNPDTDDG